MNLAVFRVCGELVMIKKELLVSQSGFFAPLFDGTLTALESNDGVIDLTERDLETFKEMLFFLNSGKLSKRTRDCEVLYDNLERMANFYLVDLLPFPTRQTDPDISLYTFKNTSFYDAAGMNAINQFMAEYATNKNFVHCDITMPHCALLIRILLGGDIVSSYHVMHQSHEGSHMVHIVSKLSKKEMEKKYLGFGSQFELKR